MKTQKVYNSKIPSNITNIGIQVDEIVNYLKSIYSSISDSVLFEIRVILNELIINAVKHGNNEDNRKFVNITTGITEDKCVFFVVEDDGQGYDYSSIGNCCCDSEKDIFDLKETGRGIMIVKNLCKKVCFNKKGNKVVVVKRLFE